MAAPVLDSRKRRWQLEADWSLVPASVILWDNGMFTVFDTAGHQMPEWQGAYDVVKEKIGALDETAVRWHFGQWDKDLYRWPKSAVMVIGRYL